MFDKQPTLHSDHLTDAENKINNINPGETIHIENIEGECFNILYDKFKPRRKSGCLQMSYDHGTRQVTAICTATPEPAPEPAPEPEPSPPTPEPPTPSE